MAAAAALRFWALDSQPGGLFPDEAAEALDAYKLLTLPHFHPVFFAGDGGREGLYAYIVAGAFKVFGVAVTTLRGTSAMLGVLGIVALYLWLRREGRPVALGASAWAAGSLWLLSVSRDGMRNVLVPLAAALALWALATFARRPSRRLALTAGGAMGLGLWTYQPLKLLPLLLVLWLGWLARRNPQAWRPMRPHLGWLAGAYVVVAAPMLYVAVTEPGLYFGHAALVAAGGLGSGVAGLLNHSLRTLLMFGFTGDPNERHNVSQAPLLSLPLVLVAGLGARRAWRHRAEPLSALVLIAVPVMLLAPLLGTADPAPHFLRSLGLAAPLAALVGWGCLEALRLGAARPRAVAALLAITLVGTGLLTVQAYFGRPVSQRWDAYSFNVVQLAAMARDHPGDAMVVDGFRLLDVQFLDRDLPAPASPCGALALSRAEMAVRYPEWAAQARPAGFDPWGRPSVWHAGC